MTFKFMKKGNRTQKPYSGMKLNFGSGSNQRKRRKHRRQMVSDGNHASYGK